MKSRKIMRGLCCLLLVCLVFNLAGCSNKKTELPKHTSAEEDDTKTPTDDPDKIKTKGIPIDQYDLKLKAELTKDENLDIEKFEWNICAFQLDNLTYSLPFSYSRISSEWSFSPADYGLDNDFQLEPLTKTSANVKLTHKSRPYTLTVGFYNPYSTPISLDKAQVWSWEIDLTTPEMDDLSIENDTPKDPADTSEDVVLPVIKPNILLPKGVQLHDSIASILLAYGEPENSNIHNSETGYYEFYYQLNYNIFLTLVLDEKEGLVKVNYKHFPANTLVTVPEDEQE